MKVEGRDYQSIWFEEKHPDRVFVIDQRYLPFNFKITELKNLKEAYSAIKDMLVRGAPVIGACAAWGMYLAALSPESADNMDDKLSQAADYLKSSRPTAVNLEYAVDESLKRIKGAFSREEKIESAKYFAQDYSVAEIKACQQIGKYGLKIIEKIAQKKNNEPVNILTHCNAGWLACIDYGTALSPIYAAHRKGIPVHVWVSETRPRNQGARITAWELGQEQVPYTLIVDNAAGHIMQANQVDMCIVGSDRTTKQGDVANKIGTYLKAIAAKENGLPFYVALPSSSIDFSIIDGVTEIPIEERDSKEIHQVEGQLEDWYVELRISPEGAKAANFGFDVTPARLVTSLITERGICDATQSAIERMFPEKI